MTESRFFWHNFPNLAAFAAGGYFVQVPRNLNEVATCGTNAPEIARNPSE